VESSIRRGGGEEGERGSLLAGKRGGPREGGKGQLPRPRSSVPNGEKGEKKATVPGALVEAIEGKMGKRTRRGKETKRVME